MEVSMSHLISTRAEARIRFPTDAQGSALRLGLVLTHAGADWSQRNSGWRKPYLGSALRVLLALLAVPLSFVACGTVPTTSEVAAPPTSVRTATLIPATAGPFDYDRHAQLDVQEVGQGAQRSGFIVHNL